MRHKQSVWIIAGLAALLLSKVVFADKELDVLMNPVVKPKKVVRVVKKHNSPKNQQHLRQKLEEQISTLKKLNSINSKLSADLLDVDTEVSTSVGSNSWQTIDRYQVKGGLVKDTKTGLMWMRCSLGQNWDGLTCQGSATEEGGRIIPKGFNYEGYSDWRVPTSTELSTLIYCGNGQPEVWWKTCEGNHLSPTIMSNVFPRTPKAWFWTSTDKPVYGGEEPIVIDFEIGMIDGEGHGCQCKTRLVRVDK